MSTNNVNLLFKTVVDIYDRLFDHRPIIQNEIAYFLQEFETKQDALNYTHFTSSLQNLQQLNKKIIPECVEFLSTKACILNEKVIESNDICEKILNNEIPSESVERLNSNRLKRSKEWTEYVEYLTKMSKLFDSDLVDELNWFEKEQIKILEKKLLLL